MGINNENKRNIAVDIMKGIGIILVIIGHSTSNGRYLIYSFHMPLFFLVGGYFFRPEESFNTILKKGIKRLILPYFITCLCICAFQAIKSAAQSESVLSTLLLWVKASLVGLPSDSIKAPNVAGMQHIGAIWFFEALFWARIELWLILKCRKLTNQLIILVSTVIILTVVSKRLFWIPANVAPGAAGCVFLWIGYVIRDRGILQKHEKKNWIYLSVLILAIVSIADRLLGKRLAIATLNFPLYGLDVMGALAGSYLVYKIAQCIANTLPKCAKTLSIIGNSSAEILCVHLWDLDCLETLIPGGLLRLGFRLVFDVGGGLVIRRICTRRKAVAYSDKEK